MCLVVSKLFAYLICFNAFNSTISVQNQIPNTASNFFQSGYPSVGYHAAPVDCYSQLQQNLMQPQHLRDISAMSTATSSPSEKNPSTLSVTHTIQTVVSLSGSSQAVTNNNFNEKKFINGHQMKNQHSIYSSQNKNQKGMLSV